MLANKIMMIKSLRIAFPDLGLVDAKKLVDAYIEVAERLTEEQRICLWGMWFHHIVEADIYINTLSEVMMNGAAFKAMARVL